MFFPGDINGFSVYDVFSYVRFVNIDVQITVFIVFSPGRILQNNVFISNLLTGQLIDLFVAILETIIQFVLRIVFKPWLVQENTQVLQRLLRSLPEVPLHRHAAECISRLEVFIVFLAVAVDLDTFLDALKACICVVWGFSVGGTVKYLIPYPASPLMLFTSVTPGTDSA